MVKLDPALQEKVVSPTQARDRFITASRNFRTYGQLSKIDVSGIQAGARVDYDRYEKGSARDFALWKAPEAGRAFLGDADRAGAAGLAHRVFGDGDEVSGRDASTFTPVGSIWRFRITKMKSRRAKRRTGKQFVKYWMHAEHLLVEGEKMSKSLGNFFTLRDLFAKGYKPSAIRFCAFSVPYRRQLNFTIDGLQQAASAVERLRNFSHRLQRREISGGACSRGWIGAHRAGARRFRSGAGRTI